MCWITHDSKLQLHMSFWKSYRTINTCCDCVEFGNGSMYQLVTFGSVSTLLKIKQYVVTIYLVDIFKKHCSQHNDLLSRFNADFKKNQKIKTISKTLKEKFKQTFASQTVAAFHTSHIISTGDATFHTQDDTVSTSQIIRACLSKYLAWLCLKQTGKPNENNTARSITQNSHCYVITHCMMG